MTDWTAEWPCEFPFAVADAVYAPRMKSMNALLGVWIPRGLCTMEGVALRAFICLCLSLCGYVSLFITSCLSLSLLVFIPLC